MPTSPAEAISKEGNRTHDGDGLRHGHLREALELPGGDGDDHVAGPPGREAEVRHVRVERHIPREHVFRGVDALLDAQGRGSQVMYPGGRGARAIF